VESAGHTKLMHEIESRLVPVLAVIEL